MRTSSPLLALAIFVWVEGLCYHQEKNYYEELGCAPVQTEGQDCPSSYDCSSLKHKSLDKCLFQGTEYEKGHRLKDIPGFACLQECECGTSHIAGKLMFSCTSLECPELLSPTLPAGCYRTYEHGKCCHVYQVCDDVTENNAQPPRSDEPVCEYRGFIYKIGEKFYPEEEPCLTCICHPDYNGSFIEPFCRKTLCNMELLYGDRIAEGCVPIYYGEKSCCPIDWRCPKGSDSVVVSSDVDTWPKLDKTCQFGNLSLRLGERLSPMPRRGGTRCSCRVPPSLVCVQQTISQRPSGVTVDVPDSVRDQQELHHLLAQS